MEEMLIKYNASCDRWCRSDGKIYRQDKNGKFIECKQTTDKDGYKTLGYKIKQKTYRLRSHRLIWETLKGGIQLGYEIDHINKIRDDNRLENLRCITHAENDTIKSVFGRKFYEHYKMSRKDNMDLYYSEKFIYDNTGHCSWE